MQEKRSPVNTSTFGQTDPPCSAVFLR